MLATISWYFITLVLGWLAFPIAFRIFSYLPDRGYSFSRILGLLLWGFSFWISASLHILPNNPGGYFTGLILVVIISLIYFGKMRGNNIFEWIQSHWKWIMVSEVVFGLLFLFMVIVRAANPLIAYTEKEMELAFINSILRSPTFPPADPWLSGYAISYYYFGYIMVAMLAGISHVSGGVAFNLAIALWYGLTGLAAFGVVANLTFSWWNSKKENKRENEKSALRAGLLGPFFLLISGNLEGFLEVLHSGGLFWNQNVSGDWISGFWRWLDILELNQPPTPPFTWQPERLSGFWWWRASRVLQDYDLFGRSKEIIDEFPAFSYLLADLHPHVLSMPFVLLAVALALNVFLKYADGNVETISWKTWISQFDFWITAIVLGGLAFLNIWDFPIYVALYAASTVLAENFKKGWSRDTIINFLIRSILLGIAGVALYFPFWVGFSSQAGGLLPSMEYFTRGVHFWIMFGILLLPIFVVLFWMNKTRRGMRRNLIKGFKFAALLVGGIWIISYSIGAVSGNLEGIGNLILSSGRSGFTGLAEHLITAGSAFTSIHDGAGISELFWTSLVNRFLNPGTWLTLVGLLVIAFRFLITQKNAEIGSHTDVRPQSWFLVLLILAGAGLTLLPEFIYLRDQFGWRMNTIFKFYFQAWILWSLAAAIGTAILFRALTGWRKALFQIGSLLLVIISLPYTIFGINTITQSFQPQQWTLDGTLYNQRFPTDESAAMTWLRQAPYGVIAEAIGGSYSEYARFAIQTGLPTVLGWPGHESQWRGGAEEMGNREADITLLYQTSNAVEAFAIIQQYQIRYIIIGALEQLIPGINETKFEGWLPVVFENQSVRIYEAPPELLNTTLP